MYTGANAEDIFIKPTDRCALIGYTGLVGSNLLNQTPFEHLYRQSNIASIRGQSYDVVVCCGAPGVKYWANQNPEQDQKAIALLKECLSDSVRVSKLFVLISTIDVYAPHTLSLGLKEADLTPETVSQEPYGRHRFDFEEFVKDTFPDHHLIVRLPGLFGPYLKKNLVYDISSSNIGPWIQLNAQYQFYDLRWLWGDIRKFVKSHPSLVRDNSHGRCSCSSTEGKSSEAVVANDISDSSPSRVWNLFTEPLPIVSKWFGESSSSSDCSGITLRDIVPPDVIEHILHTGKVAPNPVIYNAKTSYKILDIDPSSPEGFVRSSSTVFDALKSFLAESFSRTKTQQQQNYLSFSIISLPSPRSLDDFGQMLSSLYRSVSFFNNSTVDFGIELAPTKLYPLISTNSKDSLGEINNLKLYDESKSEPDWVQFWRLSGCVDERKLSSTEKLEWLQSLDSLVNCFLTSMPQKSMRLTAVQSLLFRVPYSIFGTEESAPNSILEDGLQKNPDELLEHVSHRVMPFMRYIASSFSLHAYNKREYQRQHSPVLVFGSPKQRSLRGSSEEFCLANLRDFFRRLGDEAARRGLRIGIEANPKAYGCDVLTNYNEVIDFVSSLNHSSVTVHFDTGCHFVDFMKDTSLNQGFATSNYSIEVLDKDLREILLKARNWISHIHISEPSLRRINLCAPSPFPHNIYAQALKEMLNARSPDLPPVFYSLEQLPDELGVSAVAQSLNDIVECYIK